MAFTLPGLQIAHLQVDFIYHILHHHPGALPSLPFSDCFASSRVDCERRFPSVCNHSPRVGKGEGIPQSSTGGCCSGWDRVFSSHPGITKVICKGFSSRKERRTIAGVKQRPHRTVRCEPLVNSSFRLR
ncbi:hypothetical protein NPIL_215781 [Nephila pilipes]|uniref:Uncharacterized protein n=1 Tax=Nephila pilipes TaxID=299642 RepID=A0A8X6NFE6_NEPPI|nr:hypothetical protein NPIL_215781 [Nephila pilipes]